VAVYFFCLAHNVLPAAASAGFTCSMFSFPQSFSGSFNAYIRETPALLAAGLLGAGHFILLFN